MVKDTLLLGAFQTEKIRLYLLFFWVKLREKCGSIKASCLITDMEEQHYSAWSIAFGPGTQNYIWHVGGA